MNSYVEILVKIEQFAYLTNYSCNLGKIFVGKLGYNRIWLVSSELPTMCNRFDEVAALSKLKDVNFVL